MIRWAHDNGYDYLFKADDDTFVRLLLFFSFWCGGFPAASLMLFSFLRRSRSSMALTESLIALAVASSSDYGELKSK